MEQLNKIELRGTVGIVRIKDYEGRQMARFSLATNFAYFDRNNEGIIETSWHNVIAWEGKEMPDLKKIEKGATVYVCGRLRIQKYSAQDGSEKFSYDVLANKVVIEMEKAEIQFGS